MLNNDKVAGLGGIMQLAFVPENFDAAVDYWLKMGAGPFFMLKDNLIESVECFGVKGPLVLDVALANWGDMQIEIIRQKSGGRSIYSEWRDAGKEGLHHVCVVAHDIAAARATCISNGFDVVLEGNNHGIEWFYVDTHGGDGSLVEFINTDGPAQMTREAARTWDGSNPIRGFVNTPDGPQLQP